MLLIGVGPLPEPGERRIGFPQLRTAHFAEAIARGGHAVRLALLVPEGGGDLPAEGAPWEGVWTVTEEGPGWLERVVALARDAEVLVSAGPYSPGVAAMAAVGERPWWADLPGDPFAELQAALLAADPGERVGGRVAATTACASMVLGDADAVSAISDAQRHAVIGQLGLLGRLVEDDPALAAVERVFVLPVAWAFGLPPRAPRPREAGSPLIVALSGGFNTWLDVEGLITGLDLAFQRVPGLRVIATGGGIPRHHEAGAARFAAWAEQRRDRVDLLGWLPQEALGEALSRAHIGLCLDRPGYEPELGSRTRLLLYAYQGMLGLASTRSPLARELAALEALIPLPEGRPEALAEALVAIHRRPQPVAALIQAQELLARRYDPDAVAAPLLEWLRAPRRRARGEHAGAALGRENARLRAELSAVYASPTWRALAWLHRRLGGPTR